MYNEVVVPVTGVSDCAPARPASRPDQPSDSDPMLQPLIDAGSDEEARRQIGRLMCSTIEPLVARIVQSKLHASLHKQHGPATSDELDAQDVFGAAVARLTKVLGSLWRSGRPEIRNLEAYAVTVTTREMDRFLAKANPNRSRLQATIRRLLERSTQFDLWVERPPASGPGPQVTRGAEPRPVSVCGLATWCADGTRTQESHALQQIRADPSALVYNRTPAHDASSMPLPSQLHEVFTFVGHPIPFQIVVSIAAALQGVTDGLSEPLTDDMSADEASHGATVQQPAPQAHAVRRAEVRVLWDELRALPLRARASILLDTAEFDHLPNLLVVLGLARTSEIAETLALSREELADLWPSLPLSDEDIVKYVPGMSAEHLRVVRARARQRLGKRLRDWDGP